LEEFRRETQKELGEFKGKVSNFPPYRGGPCRKMKHSPKKVNSLSPKKLQIWGNLEERSFNIQPGNRVPSIRRTLKPGSKNSKVKKKRRSQNENILFGRKG